MRRELLLKKQNSRIDFDDVDCLSDEDYVSRTGLSRTQFNSLVSSINGFRHRKVSGRTAFALLLTKLRTGLSTSILRTLFNVKSERYLSRIVKRAREALVTDFVPKYLGFENISREDIIENHTTVFARELLASGSNDTAILLLDGT